MKNIYLDYKIFNKIKEKINCSNQFCDQVKWEVLKYEICCLTIKFLKDLAKAIKGNNILLKTSLNC